MLWEESYAQVLTDAGFTRGQASPCCFYHPTKEISIVCHGDDFVALGTDSALDAYETFIADHFDIELRGRLGAEPNDCKEIQFLNRIICVVPTGLAFEADPRHVELMAQALGLENCGPKATPGSKEHDDNTAADNNLDHEDHALIQT